MGRNDAPIEKIMTNDPDSFKTVAQAGSVRIKCDGMNHWVTVERLTAPLRVSRCMCQRQLARRIEIAIQNAFRAEAHQSV